jgi:hypothetical protein
MTPARGSSEISGWFDRCGGVAAGAGFSTLGHGGCSLLSKTGGNHADQDPD